MKFFATILTTMYSQFALAGHCIGTRLNMQHTIRSGIEFSTDFQRNIKMKYSIVYGIR